MECGICDIQKSNSGNTVIEPLIFNQYHIHILHFSCYKMFYLKKCYIYFRSAQILKESAFLKCLFKRVNIDANKKLIFCY